MSSRTEILAELNAELRALLDQQTGIAALPSGWRNKSDMVATVAADIAALRAEIDAETSALSAADTVIIRRASGAEYTLPLSALIPAAIIDGYSGRISGDQLAAGTIIIDVCVYYSGTIAGFATQMDGGGGTADIKIKRNAGDVGSTAHTANGTLHTVIPDSNNAVTAGDQIKLVLSNITGTPEYLDFTIKVTKP